MVLWDVISVIVGKVFKLGEIDGENVESLTKYLKYFVMEHDVGFIVFGVTLVTQAGSGLSILAK
jgi:hypothetical protein